MKNRNQGNRKQMGGNHQGNQSNQKSQRKGQGQGMRSEAEVGEEDMGRERRE